MTLSDLQAEAATLILPHFDEPAALQLGLILTDLAKADALPIVINIRTANRTLFHLALPGSGPNNDEWARRKSNTALRFHEASFLVGTRHRDKGRNHGPARRRSGRLVRQWRRCADPGERCWRCCGGNRFRPAAGR